MRQHLAADSTRPCKSVQIDLSFMSCSCSSGGHRSAFGRRRKDAPVPTLTPPGLSRRCLLDACRACLFGLFFVIAGSIIAFFGFYNHQPSDGLLNSTEIGRLVPSRPTPSNYKLSYIGPILIGTGGFILIAVCVVILEMRDLSSKVFPLNYKHPFASSKSKLTPQLLVEMFQTPTMKLVKQLARKAARVRTIGCQTDGHHRLTSSRAVYRSWSHLADPGPPLGPFSSHQRRYRHPGNNRRSRFAPISISCPHLDHIS